MAVAVATGRYGYVVLADGKIVDHSGSRTASKSPRKAARKTSDLIEMHTPEVIVAEMPGSNRRKRGKTLALMAAVERSAKASDAVCVMLSKTRGYRNKYEEAKALADEFPEMRPYLPEKPEFWKSEPHRMIVFEALALAIRLRETG